MQHRVHSFEYKQMFCFDLFDPRGERGTNGRGEFGGAIRPRFGLENVKRRPGNYVPYVAQCFRVGNRSSGPDFGRILVGEKSKSAHRPAEEWPEGRF